MNNDPHIDRNLAPAELAELMDAAKARAVAARSEALDAFWRAGVAAARRAWRHLAGRGGPVRGAAHRAGHPGMRPARHRAAH